MPLTPWLSQALMPKMEVDQEGEAKVRKQNGGGGGRLDVVLGDIVDVTEWKIWEGVVEEVW